MTDDLLLVEEPVLHDGAEDLVRDVGHHGVGGRLPDQLQQHGVTPLGRQHTAVPGYRVVNNDGYI